MTGLQMFVAADMALLAAFVHWRVWHRRPPRAARADPPHASHRTRSARPMRQIARPDPARPEMNAFGGKIHVVDGDTVIVNRARVRLFGMDAPEMSQRGGRQAKAHLIRMAGGKEVRVLPVAVDCYGRIVGRVLLGQVDLSHAMVREGFAVAMRAYHDDYVLAEAAARRDRSGLWADDPEHGIDDPAAHRRRLAGHEPRRDARPSDNAFRLGSPPSS